MLHVLGAQTSENGPDLSPNPAGPNDTPAAAVNNRERMELLS